MKFNISAVSCKIVIYFSKWMRLTNFKNVFIKLIFLVISH